jgi:hypothetical protein
MEKLTLCKELLEQIAFFFVNISRNSDEKSILKLESIFPLLDKLMSMSDNTIIKYATEALYHLSNDSSNKNVKIECLVNPKYNFVNRLVEFWSYANVDADVYDDDGRDHDVNDDDDDSGEGREEEYKEYDVLRSLLNISSGTDGQTTLLTNNPLFMPSLRRHLSAKSCEIRRLTYHILSNIAAGTLGHKFSILIHDILPTLITATLKSRQEVRLEAVYAFSNLLSTATDIELVKSYLNSLSSSFATATMSTSNTFKSLFSSNVDESIDDSIDDSKRQRQEHELASVEEKKRLIELIELQMSRHEQLITFYNSSSEGIKIICEMMSEKLENRCIHNLLETVYHLFKKKKLTPEIVDQFEEFGGFDKLNLIEKNTENEEIIEIVNKIQKLFDRVRVDQDY